MAEQFSGQVQYVLGNELPSLSYSKADLAKACRINEAFAVSFYQLNYQAVANVMAAAGNNAARIEAIAPIPVAKVVMDRDALFRLKSEVDQLVAILEREGKETKAK